MDHVMEWSMNPPVLLVVWLSFAAKKGSWVCVSCLNKAPGANSFALPARGRTLAVQARRRGPMRGWPELGSPLFFLDLVA